MIANNARALPGCRATAAAVFLLPLIAGCSRAPEAGAGDQAAVGEWRHYAAGHASTKYSPLDQINPSNVDRLREVWRWTSVETEADTEHRGGMYKSTPLYIDGTLYITTSLSQVAALDPATGETLWVYDPRSYEVGRPANAGFQHRGLEYWRGELDGAKLWEHRVEPTPHGTPMTYLHEGRQYVAFTVGRGEQSPALVALALE